MSATRNKIDRQTRLAHLRLSGVTDQRRLAALLGVNQSTISRDFAELDEQFRMLAAQDIVAAKGLDLERIEAMIAALWPEAMSGQAKTWHVDRILKCIERRAALLGLDAPQKRESTVHADVVLRSFAERAAIEAGLDPQLVLAEAERILSEAD